MKDEDKLELLLTHDKHIEVMSQSIEHLAQAVGTTNRKMEDIIDVISTQNVMMEKVNNIDENLKESFSRVHVRIGIIEDAQNTEGCAALRVQANTILHNAQELKWLNSEVKGFKEEAKKAIPSWLLKFMIGLLIVQSISFGTYVFTSIQDIKVETSSHYATAVSKSANIKSKLAEHDGFINRNFGRIQDISGGK